MRLLRFDRIEYRVFADFTWGDNEQLRDFGLFNLIYSPNGSGKSTLADILRRVRTGTPVEAGRVVMTFDDGTVTLTPSSAPGNLESLVRVFDPEYRQTNLDNFEGIHWAIGQEAVDAAADTARLTQQIQRTIELTQQAETQLNIDTRALDSFCQQTATELRTLKRLIPGQERANYSEAYLRSSLDAVNSSTASKTSLPAEEVATKRSFLQERVLLPTIDLRAESGPTDLGPLIVKVESLSKEASTVTPDKPAWIAGRQSWLSEGLRFLEDDQHQACPFCGQTVSAERESELSENLRGEHEAFIARVGSALGEVAAASVDLRSLAIPEPSAVLAPVRESFKMAVEALTESLATYRVSLAAMKKRLSRIRESSIPIKEVVALDRGTAIDAWKRVLQAVEAHNALVRGHTEECERAFQDLEADLLHTVSPKYRDLVAKVSSSQAAVSDIRVQLRTGKAELRQVEASIQRIDHAVDALNADLAAYLGHADLQLQVVGDGYQILRGGAPTLTVSEGERTAITLLHFLRSLDDEQFDRENGIVIIDDPVSSLDSTALHSAAAFVINAIADRESRLPRSQVIVTTHNFAFFRLLRAWSRHLKKDPAGGPADRYYSIRTERSAGGRSSSIVPIDKLLLTFNSEYQYLFYKVRNFTPGEESLYILNLARRLLEAFLAFRVPTEVRLDLQLEEILEILPTIGSEQKHRLRLLCNTGSHSAAVPTSEGQLAQIDEAALAVEALMDLMAAADPTHHARMIGLVDAISGR